MSLLANVISTIGGTRNRDNCITHVIHRNLTYLDRQALKDLYDAVRSVDSRSIRGDLVECGCALGGSAIVMASAKRPERRLFVHDVFGVIPPPGEKDGEDVHERYRTILAGQSRGIGGDAYYGYQNNLIALVRTHFSEAGIDPDSSSVVLIPGLFQETLCGESPLALVHVDGDWYDSVMTCLTKLWPRTSVGGVVVVDDYDAWSGCRQAVDDYFQSIDRRYYKFVKKSRLHIHRIM